MVVDLVWPHISASCYIGKCGGAFPASRRRNQSSNDCSWVVSTKCAVSATFVAAPDGWRGRVRRYLLTPRPYQVSRPDSRFTSSQRALFECEARGWGTCGGRQTEDNSATQGLGLPLRFRFGAEFVWPVPECAHKMGGGHSKDDIPSKWLKASRLPWDHPVDSSWLKESIRSGKLAPCYPPYEEDDLEHLGVFPFTMAPMKSAEQL